MQDILNKLVESRILTILETININYPDKFAKHNINKERIIIKEHISWKIDKPKVKPKVKQKVNQKSKDIRKYKNIKKKVKLKLKNTEKDNSEKDNSNVEKELNRCSGRIWFNYIINTKTMTKINDIDNKFKVDDFIDLDIKDFNSKYSIGLRCSKNKTIDSKYCKLHSKHLIHGDYLESPNKELCYHFMKDGNYL